MYDEANVMCHITGEKGKGKREGDGDDVDSLSDGEDLEHQHQQRQRQHDEEEEEREIKLLLEDQLKKQFEALCGKPLTLDEESDHMSGSISSVPVMVALVKQLRAIPEDDSEEKERAVHLRRELEGSNDGESKQKGKEKVSSSSGSCASMLANINIVSLNI